MDDPFVGLDGVALHLEDQLYNMWILLDFWLLLEQQIQMVAREVFGQLCVVHHLLSFLDEKVLNTGNHAVINSRLGYCNLLYMKLPLMLSWKLQKALNVAA